MESNPDPTKWNLLISVKLGGEESKEEKSATLSYGPKAIFIPGLPFLWSKKYLKLEYDIRIHHVQVDFLKYLLFRFDT